MRIARNLNWMTSLQTQIQAFKELLIEYINYLEIDLANSLINKTRFSRNVRLLNSFRKIFSLALDPEYKENRFKFNLELLKMSIRKYGGNTKNTIKLKDKICIDTNLIQRLVLSDERFRRRYTEFYLSNNAFSKAFKNSLINKEDFKDYLNLRSSDGKYTFAQSLLEFNNALSHLIMAVCQKHKSTQQQNVKSAMNHLYRATLDNYKIIIRFSMHKVQNNEYILKSFLSIRENEFLFLGEDIKSKKIKFYNPDEKITEDKDILIAYKTLFESIERLIYACQ